MAYSTRAYRYSLWRFFEGTRNTTRDALLKCRHCPGYFPRNRARIHILNEHSDLLARGVQEGWVTVIATPRHIRGGFNGKILERGLIKLEVRTK